ncbi:hypothetical protein A0O28_0028480 [Trichoderma guizhouense]|uniref:Hydrophobin n=1 Tax=Trichoderma guizhouense TaxID=1491466 RepID=A0A1T3CTW9_9HYPO|nr:hypothetical protein A0O28_0028480 [Trichoderma guizhouense]
MFLPLPPPPPTNQNTNTNNNWQSNSCGNGASPYCCSATADGLGENYWKCSDLNDVCNDVIVCCNNNSNNNNQQGKQNNIDTGNQSCSAFGQQKVVYL